MVRGQARNRTRFRSKEKVARRRLLNSILMMDQTAINAGFDFRRYAMKPMPAKPRIIMAHVESSGYFPSASWTMIKKAKIGYLSVANLEFDLDRIVAYEIFARLVEQRDAWNFPDRASVRCRNICHNDL